MDVTMVLTERCDHQDDIRAVLQEALDETGLTDLVVQETQIRSDEEAIETKCIGSPTIRVDGLDVEYQEREPDERSSGCRYFNTTGGWKPVPEKGMIVRSLERAKERDAGE